MASSNDGKTGRLVVYDTIAAPGQRVTLSADLVEEGLFTQSPLGGEVVVFLLEGRSLGHAMTGGDGRAAKSFVAKAAGVATMTVRLENARRVTASEATARLFVWDRRRPIILVSLAAFAARSPKPGEGLPFSFSEGTPPNPEVRAVDALTALSRRANMIYVTGADRLDVAGLRGWADHHRLPAGPIVPVKAGPHGLATELENWRRAGWGNIKGGLAGTPDEAKVLVAGGLKAVVPPSASSKEKWPERAVKTKDWSDVAKRLLS
jgi:hypothetical protein